MNNDISMDNIDNLTEDQLRLLEQKYKDEHLPTYRLMLLVPYNIIVAGMTMYYTIHFKYYSKKLFQPKNYGFLSLIKYGTLQSITFMTVYIGGTALVTGVYNPISYLRGLAAIKGKQIDSALKFDPYVQQHFLFNMMKYFGLSQTLLVQAESEMTSQRQKLEDTKFFSEDTLKLLNQPIDADDKL